MLFQTKCVYDNFKYQKLVKTMILNKILLKVSGQQMQSTIQKLKFHIKY